MKPSMDIVISRGLGTGRTTLSAFDAALAAAGIANLNLLCLSSVIPPGARVRCGSASEALAAFSEVEWGDRLYCVLAQSRAAEPGQEAWAGIGWWQDADGHGVFVEHHGHDKAEVTADVECSLRECVERRGRSLEEGCWQTAVNGARCVDRPICALVVAIYATQGWGLRCGLTLGLCATGPPAPDVRCAGTPESGRRPDC